MTKSSFKQEHDFGMISFLLVYHIVWFRITEETNPNSLLFSFYREEESWSCENQGEIPRQNSGKVFLTFSLINYCRLGLSCCCSFYMMIYEAVFAFNNWLKLQSFILWLLGEGVFLFFSKTRSFNEIGGFAWSFKFWHEMTVGLYNEEKLPKYFVVHLREQNTKSCVYFSCWKKLLKSWNNLGGRTCLNLVCFDMGFRGALIIWAWLLHWAEICGWV